MFFYTWSHARTVFCITSCIVKRRARTASCSSNISLVFFFTTSNIFRVLEPFKCSRSIDMISSLACNDHFTLITWILNENVTNLSQTIVLGSSIIITWRGITRIPCCLILPYMTDCYQLFYFDFSISRTLNTFINFLHVYLFYLIQKLYVNFLMFKLLSISIN